MNRLYCRIYNFNVSNLILFPSELLRKDFLSQTTQDYTYESLNAPENYTLHIFLHLTTLFLFFFFFFYQNTWEKGMKDRVAFIRSIHSQRRNSSLSVEGNHCQQRKISVTVSLGT